MNFKKISAIIMGILIFAFGIYAAMLGNKGPGDIEAYTGQLILKEGAYDPDFDLRVNSAVLIRKVEMYQYVLNGNTITTDFSENHEPQRTANNKTYRNPYFPDEPKSKVFCGAVTIGDSELLVSSKILEKLSYGSYVDFKKQPQKVPVRVIDNGRIHNLIALDEYTYGTPGGEYWEVGDIRVTWYAIDMDTLSNIYTVAGHRQDGVIGDEDHVVFAYDYAIPLSEIKNKFSKENKITGLILTFVGVGIIGITLLPLLRKDN